MFCCLVLRVVFYTTVVFLDVACSIIYFSFYNRYILIFCTAAFCTSALSARITFSAVPFSMGKKDKIRDLGLLLCYGPTPVYASIIHTDPTLRLVPWFVCLFVG